MRQIQLHKEKILIEELKSEPDLRVIHHWQAEINAFQKSMDIVERRLGR